MRFHFPALPFSLNLALLGLGACSALGQDQCDRSDDLPKLILVAQKAYEFISLKESKENEEQIPI